MEKTFDCINYDCHPKYNEGSKLGYSQGANYENDMMLTDETADGEKETTSLGGFEGGVEWEPFLVVILLLLLASSFFVRKVGNKKSGEGGEEVFENGKISNLLRTIFGWRGVRGGGDVSERKGGSTDV